MRKNAHNNLLLNQSLVKLPKNKNIEQLFITRVPKIYTPLTLVKLTTVEISFKLTTFGLHGQIVDAIHHMRDKSGCTIILDQKNKISGLLQQK